MVVMNKYKFNEFEDITEYNVYEEFVFITSKNSKDIREILFQNSVYIETIENEDLLDYIDIEDDELLKQMLLDIPRMNITINSKRIRDHTSIIDFVIIHPYLRCNTKILFIACSQLIMVYPCYILYKLTKKAVAELEDNEHLNIVIEPTKISINKTLRTLEEVHGKIIKGSTYHIRVEVDLFTDESIIIISKID